MRVTGDDFFSGAPSFAKRRVGILNCFLTGRWTLSSDRHVLAEGGDFELFFNWSLDAEL